MTAATGIGLRGWERSDAVEAKTRPLGQDKPAETTAEAACTYPAALICCSDFVLGTLSMTVAELVEEALAPLDLRLRHYRLLRLLFFDGPQSQSALGPALGVDRTTVVALVDHLERLKLAKRVRSEEDRRAYRIALTEKGRKVATKAAEIVNSVEESMFSPLSAEEREHLTRLSTRLLSEPGIIADAHARAIREESRHGR
ncbi:MAG TPA: MarR family transcriptional regulator [Candidatus Limnocylindria bacterium]|nr:MarR family transcriptional regulator [Candidatus Limnocylindria bacterium]